MGRKNIFDRMDEIDQASDNKTAFKLYVKMMLRYTAIFGAILLGAYALPYVIGFICLIFF